MGTNIEQIRKNIQPLQQKIVQHPVYGAIETIADIRIFMQYHVFAVWDFMSLLKALQNNLTCTTVPWFPTGDAATRFLINEIVVGEESDVDQAGERTSHYELYLKGMQQCGADTKTIEGFTTTLQETGNFEEAFALSASPPAARSFVAHTFKVIETKQAHLQAAVFSFGREDLIPSMFHSIIADIVKTQPDAISIFHYYLERHIEVDGGHHSELAMQMVTNLCGDKDEYWLGAQQAVTDCLLQRIQLWDGAYEAIREQKNKS